MSKKIGLALSSIVIMLSVLAIVPTQQASAHTLPTSQELSVVSSSNYYGCSWYVNLSTYNEETWIYMNDCFLHEFENRGFVARVAAVAAVLGAVCFFTGVEVLCVGEVTFAAYLGVYIADLLDYSDRCGNSGAYLVLQTQGGMRASPTCSY